MAPGLQARTRRFAIDVLALAESFPRKKSADVVSYQLIKAATSVGANCREADRAESRRDFIHKMALAEKECAEAQYWLELADASKFADEQELLRLYQESDELLSILITIGRKAKKIPSPPRR